MRICKGIYVEPRTIAWKDRQTVIRNFAALVDKQLIGGAYAAIATHDEACVQLALATIDRLGIPKDRYEFQMLLGVDPVLRRVAPRRRPPAARLRALRQGLVRLFHPPAQGKPLHRAGTILRSFLGFGPAAPAGAS